ncbi:MAG: hypothetical protein HY744_11550 [Deltaproteobacteria bacterium]|nr:hypothetical protein [Deltaproteobacteria bacterium]
MRADLAIWAWAALAAAGCGAETGPDGGNTSSGAAAAGGAGGAGGGSGAVAGAAAAGGGCDPEACPGKDETCGKRTCTGGACAVQAAPKGTPCPEDGGGVCDGEGHCAKIPAGGSCTKATACESGYCADGVCCTSACEGPCGSCAQAGSEGTCSPQAAGTDIYFGGQVHKSAGSFDGFLAKVKADASEDWSKSFGGPGAQHARRVTVDAAGSMLVAGDFDGTINLGGDDLTSTGGRDLFVAKFDKSGKHLWSRSYGGEDDAELTGLGVDGTGSVLLAGAFRGTLDFAPLELLTSAGAEDIFVVRLDPGGFPLWARRFGDADGQRATALLPSGLTEAIVVGELRGSADFGLGPAFSMGGSDVFLLRLDGFGLPMLTLFWGDDLDQSPAAIAFTPKGNLLMAGTFQGTMVFGGGQSLTSAGGDDAFVVEFDKDGAAVWSRSFGDPAAQSASDVGLDGAGNVLLAGAINGVVKVGPSTLVGAGGGDIFVAKLTPAGVPLWGRRYGDKLPQKALAVAGDQSGNVLATGVMTGNVNFGAGVLNASDPDMFLLKLSP